MSNFPPERLLIQTEQVQTRKPVSESLMQAMAGSINKELIEHVETVVFNANGAYKSATVKPRIDAFYRFKYNAMLVGACIFNGDAGTSGTTQADVKRFTSPGGIGSSIFTTKPAVSSAASSNVWCANGETVTGCTAPVLISNPYNVNAGDVLMMNLISAMGGAPKDLQLEIYWLPR